MAIVARARLIQLLASGGKEYEHGCIDQPVGGEFRCGHHLESSRRVLVSGTVIAVLELYLRARQSAGPRGRFAMASGLVVLTVLMAVGIFGFYMFTRPLLEAMK